MSKYSRAMGLHVSARPRREVPRGVRVQFIESLEQRVLLSAPCQPSDCLDTSGDRVADLAVPAVHSRMNAALQRPVLSREPTAPGSLRLAVPAAADPLTLPERRSLVAAEGWTTEFLVPYTFRYTYETGPARRDQGEVPKGAQAVVSFDIPESHAQYRYLGKYKRSMLYDNALAVVTFSMRREFGLASSVLKTLQHLQNADGSIGFSFNTTGDNFYNESYLRTGAIAWAGYAAVHEAIQSGDKSFLGFARKVASWVLQQQIKDPADPRHGLVTAGSGTWVGNRVEPGRLGFCVTEHQIDAFFFLRDLGWLTGQAKYKNAAELIRISLLGRLWSTAEKRFNAATSITGNVDTAEALDANSWGAIFCTAIRDKVKAQQCLDFVEQHVRSVDRKVSGYRPYDGYIPDYPEILDWGKAGMVWSEGSLGVALAYLKRGNLQKSRSIVGGILKMQRKDGGVLYSTRERRDFLAVPSAAGTHWLTMVLRSMASKKAFKSFWG